MKYMIVMLDLLRMFIAIPLYLAAMMFGGIAAIFEYAADKVDVLDGPPEPGRG